MTHSPSIPFSDSSPAARARRPMKPSGVPWIGEIPEGWETNTVFQIFTQVKNKNSDLRERNLLSLSYGKIKRKNIETTEGLLPESFDGYNIIEADDIVLRLTDLQNDQRSLRVGIATERGIVTSAYVTLRNRSHSLAKYLYYFLYAFDISKGFYGMGGGIRQGLNWDGLKWVKILSPPVIEQHRIAAYLDAECARIDSIIEKTRASIEEYKKLKQSVITEAVTKGIRKGRAMKESGIEWIGEIPAEWGIVRIRFAGQVKTGPFGTQFSAEEYADEGIPLINVKNIGSGFIRTEDLDKIPANIADRLKEHKLNPNDIVFARKGSIDKHAIIKEEHSGWVQGSDCIRLRLFAGIIPAYLNYYLESAIIKGYLWTASNGATMASLNSEMIENIYVVLPSSSEQQSIVEFLVARCSEIDHLIEAKQCLLAALETYKKSLIYETVTGKKEVPA